MPDFSNLGFTANPYLQKQVNAALADTTRAYNQSTQPAFNAAMVRSGSFGNSGVQEMNQEAQRQLQTSLGRQANDMRSGNFWQGANFDAQNYWNNQNFDRSVYNDTFSQNQQQYQNGLNLLGMQAGANTQNLGLGTQIQNAPMNYYQGFTDIGNSIGRGYGNSNTQANASGSPLMGALGGYQLWRSFSGQPASSNGATGWQPTNAGSSNYGVGNPNNMFDGVDTSSWTMA